MPKPFRSDAFIFRPTAMAAALAPVVGKPLVFSREPKLTVTERSR